MTERTRSEFELWVVASLTAANTGRHAKFIPLPINTATSGHEPTPPVRWGIATTGLVGLHQRPSSQKGTPLEHAPCGLHCRSAELVRK